METLLNIFILITIVVSFFLFVNYIVGRFGTTIVVFFLFRSISMGLEKLGVSSILKNSILWSLKLLFVDLWTWEDTQLMIGPNLNESPPASPQLVGQVEAGIDLNRSPLASPLETGIDLNRSPPASPQLVGQVAQAVPLVPEQIRTRAIYNRYLLLNLGGDNDLRRMVSIIDKQLRIEQHIEAALLNDGYHAESIRQQLPKIRGLIHSPRGDLLSERTYQTYLKQIREGGARQSLPYLRIMSAITNYDLFLDRRR